MSDNEPVVITNREIWEALQAIGSKLEDITRKVEVNFATHNLRVTQLETRAGKGWDFWLAIASGAVSLPLSAYAALHGAT